MDMTPTSRLSCSMLSAASSIVKRIDVGSSGLSHQSKGSPCIGESLPTDVRVRDGSPSAPIAADPSRRDVPAGTLPPAPEGVSGMDADSFVNEDKDRSFVLIGDVTGNVTSWPSTFCFSKGNTFDLTYCRL